MGLHILKVTRNGVQYKITLPKVIASEFDVDVKKYFAAEVVDKKRILLTQVIRGNDGKGEGKENTDRADRRT